MERKFLPQHPDDELRKGVEIKLLRNRTLSGKFVIIQETTDEQTKTIVYFASQIPEHEEILNQALEDHAQGVFVGAGSIDKSGLLPYVLFQAFSH